LARVLRRFDFDFDEDKLKGKDDINSTPTSPIGLNHPVGMRTESTIYTRNGLHMTVKKRVMNDIWPQSKQGASSF
jgi:hypothetical protein